MEHSLFLFIFFVFSFLESMHDASSISKQAGDGRACPDKTERQHAISGRDVAVDAMDGHRDIEGCNIPAF